MENNTSTSESMQPETATWLAGRYVVGIDGSEDSKNALRHAIVLARLAGAKVEATIAWQFPMIYGPEWTPTDWSPEADARNILNDTLNSIIGADTSPWLIPVVREGITTAVLLDQSDGADLLIVGSRGHGGFTGLLIGSVSSACAEHATCPVLVVHGDRAVLPDPTELASLDL